MEMTKTFSAAFIGLLAMTSCKKEESVLLPETIQQEARQEMNIPYGESSQQKMDVYFPQGYNSTTPVVFMLHGGGFVAGTKEDFAFQSVIFRNQGFIIVNVSYRLVDSTGMFVYPIVHKPSEVKISEQLDDIDMAIRTYTAYASRWNAGSSKMYVAGASAGAILAMLYANSDYNKDGHIRASGNWCGATDMTIESDASVNAAEPWYTELFYRCTGTMPSVANNAAYKAVSPFWLVYKHNGGAPNISIIPSNTAVFNNFFDRGFGITPTRAFHNLLSDYGTHERMVVYEGENHSFSNKTGSWEKLIGETADFFRAN